jgi:hypothetical protein
MMQTSIASSVATYHEENPMKMRWKAALWFMAVVGVLQAQTPAVAPQRGGAALRQPAQIAPYDFNEHQGWQQMFDGSTLKGWDGPMDVWHVEDGAITAKDPEGSVYLFWGGGMLKNFEFKTEMKLEGEGANTGIQFRAIRLGPVPGKKNSEWESRGYQADFTYTIAPPAPSLNAVTVRDAGYHRDPIALRAVKWYALRRRRAKSLRSLPTWVIQTS